MDSKSVIKINMKIANRTYPITIDAEDESALRTIEKEINGKIQFYKTEYESIDQLDAVTMTLLTYAHDLSKTGKPSSDPSQLSETLDHIDAMLSDAIS